MPEELTEAARALSHDVQELIPAMREHREVADRADRNAKRAIIGGILTAHIGLIAIIMGLFSYQTGQDLRGDAAQREETTRVARISVCHEDNQRRDRIIAASVEAVASGLRALVPTPTLTEQQETQLAAFRDAQHAKFEAEYPYRDCSPQGIADYYARPIEDPATHQTTTR